MTWDRSAGEIWKDCGKVFRAAYVHLQLGRRRGWLGHGGLEFGNDDALQIVPGTSHFDRPFNDAKNSDSMLSSDRPLFISHSHRVTILIIRIVLFRTGSLVIGPLWS
jgi:hypothetical protein